MNNRWIKLLALTAILSAACSDALADMRGEYFWNDDPGVGRATALTLPDGDADGYRRADIATAGMHEGLNMLGVRVCNGKRWSVTQQAMVWYRPAGDPAVTAAEYYWNDDPGVGQATAIAAPAVDGGECGAFGGSHPYVLSGIPTNMPSITEAKIPSTPTDGKLAITLKIAIQND